MKLTADHCSARLKEQNLTSKNNVAGFDEKIIKSATKMELKSEQDKFVNLRTFDLSYFCDKNHFENDDTQN